MRATAYGSAHDQMRLPASAYPTSTNTCRINCVKNGPFVNVFEEISPLAFWTTIAFSAASRCSNTTDTNAAKRLDDCFDRDTSF